MVRARSLDEVEDTKEEVRGILRKVRGLKPRDEDDFAMEMGYSKTFKGHGIDMDLNAVDHYLKIAWLEMTFNLSNLLGSIKLRANLGFELTSDPDFVSYLP